MKKEERMEEIERMLKNAKKPLSGDRLAEIFKVTRQVIVQDIGLLRAKNVPIVSTNRGYIYEKNLPRHYRTFKVRHDDAAILEEMNAIVDLGAQIEDVYIWHRNYGKIQAKIEAKNRKDVQAFLGSMKTSVSRPLKNITDGYHYHTISAKNEETLDLVEEMLDERGYLIQED